MNAIAPIAALIVANDPNNKPMTAQEAVVKLKFIAGGQYHCLTDDITIFEDYNKDNDPRTRREKSLYVSGIGFHKGKTWEEAFEKLDEYEKAIATTG